jgi:hypothetical protein
MKAFVTVLIMIAWLGSLYGVWLWTSGAEDNGSRAAPILTETQVVDLVLTQIYQRITVDAEGAILNMPVGRCYITDEPSTPDFPKVTYLPNGTWLVKMNNRDSCTFLLEEATGRLKGF